MSEAAAATRELGTGLSDISGDYRWRVGPDGVLAAWFERVPTSDW